MNEPAIPLNAADDLDLQRRFPWVIHQGAELPIPVIA
jgi:hypothetical protein